MAIVINGSGTVTGLAVGGLPDGTVDDGTLASSAVTEAKIATDAVTAAKIPASLENTFVSGRKNMVINGAMRVAQRGTSNAAFGAGYLIADRFRFGNNNSYGNQSQYTVTQDSNAPDGFAYSMKLSVGADIAAPASSAASFIEQIFEKTDVDCLAYGTSSAKTVTLSFWVKSSLTGQFGVALAINSTISNSRNYTISSANTWEKKTLTFTGNTSTAISGDTFKLRFGLAFGSALAQSGGDSWVSGGYYGASGNVNLGDTQNATWQFTGVQLELGTVATDFEYKSYAEELALCHRYYQANIDKNSVFVTTMTNSGSVYYYGRDWRVDMRAAPTVTLSDHANSGFNDAVLGDITYSNWRYQATASSSANNSYMRFLYKADAEL